MAPCPAKQPQGAQQVSDSLSSVRSVRVVRAVKLQWQLSVPVSVPCVDKNLPVVRVAVAVQPRKKDMQHKPPAKGLWLPLLLKFGTKLVPVHGLADSGAECTIILGQGIIPPTCLSLAVQPLQLKGAQGLGIPGGSHGAECCISMCVVEGKCPKLYEFPPCFVHEADVGPIAIVGYAFLKRYSLVIDCLHDCLRPAPTVKPKQLPKGFVTSKAYPVPSEWLAPTPVCDAVSDCCAVESCIAFRKIYGEGLCGCGDSPLPSLPSSSSPPLCELAGDATPVATLSASPAPSSSSPLCALAGDATPVDTQISTQKQSSMDAKFATKFATHVQPSSLCLPLGPGSPLEVSSGTNPEVPKETSQVRDGVPKLLCTGYSGSEATNPLACGWARQQARGQPLGAEGDVTGRFSACRNARATRPPTSKLSRSPKGIQWDPWPPSLLCPPPVTP